MAEKMKKTKKQRAHKTSKGINGGGGKVRLTEVQKILIVNGGIGHGRLRRRQSALTAPKMIGRIEKKELER